MTASGDNVLQAGEGCTNGALLHRAVDQQRPQMEFYVDGRRAIGRQGDTVLTAVLTLNAALRASDFSGAPRAGFCLMGACQDCWLWLENGERLRACSTLLQAGMRLSTQPRGEV